jgi:hypothetical protein
MTNMHQDQTTASRLHQTDRIWQIYPPPLPLAQNRNSKKSNTPLGFQNIVAKRGTRKEQGTSRGLVMPAAQVITSGEPFWS